MRDKNTIIANFSRWASEYDRYSKLQLLAAEELSKELPAGHAVSRILEIGCGTGAFTAFLRGHFEGARITALDISDEMIRTARRKLEDVKFIVGDAERIRFKERFDLIASNAAFQWFENPDTSIGNFRALLMAGGILAFSTFGPMTFRELGIAVRNTAQSAGITSSAFPDKCALSAMLRKHFSDVSIREIERFEEYPSLKDLLMTIRCTGARGDASGGLFLWRRRLFDTLENQYRREFGSIKATYQIYICRAGA